MFLFSFNKTFFMSPIRETFFPDCEENRPGGSNNQNNIVKESNLFDVLKVLRESKRRKNTGLDEKYKRFSMNNIEDIKSSALNIFHFSPTANRGGNKMTEPEGKKINVENDKQPPSKLTKSKF